VPSFPFIESRRNPKFKTWVNYAEHPEEPGCPWLPVEGWKNLSDLGQKIELLLFADPSDTRLPSLLPRVRQAVQLTPQLLKAVSQMTSPQSALGFVKKPHWDWDSIKPWVFYLDCIQDPGNLGTLLRTAGATGIFSIVTSAGSVSCFNTKVVRASAATLYSVPFLQGVGVDELRQRGYTIWAAVPSGGTPLYNARFEPPCAVIVGNEGRGVNPAILADGDSRLTIPMCTEAESLNAGVAGSIIMYEVLRQRVLS